ncbi:MAG: ribonuclease Y [Bdellovibrionales bacterium RIFOXYB1_FULL_37_110]|nr:MAG: ribonuclease Y [Bdellovibrionales bacterium RIFOXYA1_FULL_38_20]OFZ48917.1 MAG: ribonuclease Y [Bdellovibrionales bacterium RIFOXYC1_FULL_37_79]OFZ59594.1 MAG: ribonuclease Y [Bdellovibrionales bacterium RIFOXYB1_FULL_37_110]OFZ62427.1 MAG: ribonuclease Y [Bdellovibrionales bacterium RIFOXYD1_FULL_36_51]
MNTLVVLVGVICILLGVGIGVLIRHIFVLKDLKQREGKADEIITKAKNDANDIKYNARKEAKDIIREEKQQAELEIKNMKQEISNQEKVLAKKEATLDAKIELQEKELEKVKTKDAEIEKRKDLIDEEIHKYKRKQIEISEKLSQVSGMSKEDAKNELMKNMVEEAKVGFAKELKRLEEEANDQAEKKSKKIISTAIERYAGEYVAEKTIGSVDLPSDDVKGRLIGREGRNIRAFEQICGVDLIIDDTPEIVVVSSFNVVRKEIAIKTIKKLIADGRIHPAKIEELHEKAKSEMDKELRELGEKAQMEVGIHGIHPEVLKLIGALNFRTSYTQNQYQHALETSFICGAMASELGLNVKQARRAGLLHDVGKVLDASAEGSHAVVGADFLKRFGESPDIIHAVRSHHDDEKPESVLAHLVAAADALSGARPGARKAMMESYVSRMTDIEQIVNSFEGVSKSYAISGGREVRVFVENDRVNDEQTVMLSHEIAKKIESEMSYPGTIKITVLRETKAVGVAR